MVNDVSTAVSVCIWIIIAVFAVFAVCARW